MSIKPMQLAAPVFKGRSLSCGLVHSVTNRASSRWRVVASQLMRRAVRQPRGHEAMQALFWVAVLFLCACSPQPNRDAPVTDSSPPPDTAPAAASDRIGNVDSLPRTPGSILPLLSAYGYSLGEERVTVVARLGPPDSVTAGPGIFGADTTFALWYPEAVVQVAHWNADEHELMGGIRVWGTLPDLPPVVSPGVTTRSNLRAWLGRPHYKPRAVADTTVWTYDGGGWATELIRFYMVRDTVRVIFLQFRMG